MADLRILEALAVKGADIGALADRLIIDSQQIPELVDALQTKSAKKYAYEKILRFISERRPDLIYPHFEVTSLLDCAKGVKLPEMGRDHDHRQSHGRQIRRRNSSLSSGNTWIR